MARSDTDSWDLASSVGATATMVAAARALATEDADPIINDPFAAPLVRAVGIEFFTRVVDGEIDPADAGEDGTIELQTETDSLAVRTRFFDEFFINAAAAGIGQAVILAAGLDARAYRLNWPAGSVVYEVDQPQVVAFKTETMARLGAAPTAQRRTVSIDLRDDWPAA
jgi:methyltransferase (TIGR00027 family)